MAKKKEAPLREWDMLPNEKPFLYERFCWYRDSAYLLEQNEDTGELQATMELDKTKRRSYKEVARHFNVALSVIEDQGKRYEWQKRCKAFDSYIVQAAQQKKEREIIQMQKNHIALGKAMINRAAKRFLSLPEEEISTADAIRMADIGVKIERQARGISNEPGQTQEKDNAAGQQQTSTLAEYIIQTYSRNHGGGYGGDGTGDR